MTNTNDNKRNSKQAFKLYNFYIGTADKDELIKLKPDKEFIACFDMLFGNYTLQRAQGRYEMQELNTTIDEDTFIVTAYANFTNDELKVIVANLKRLLNQESIMVTITEPTVLFL